MSGTDEAELSPDNGEAGSSELISEHTIPRKAYLRNKGVCDVLSYDGNGFFTLLDKRDHRIFVHRSRISFRKG